LISAGVFQRLIDRMATRGLWRWLLALVAAALTLALPTPAAGACFDYAEPFACMQRTTSEGCAWCFGGSFGGFCAPRARLAEFQALGACASTLDVAYHSPGPSTLFSLPRPK
jgi:hypothetical protein